MQRALFFFLLLIVTSFCYGQQLQELKPVLDMQAGQRIIEIPKGRYLLDNSRDGAYVFAGLVGVEIRGNGSEIICNSQEQALRFFDCTNIKISNFSIDYDPLCFTQGKIVVIDSAENSFEVEIDAGYSVDHVRNNRVQFYDPFTRELKRNSITRGSDHYAAFEKIADRHFRLVKNARWVANEKLGDLVVLDVVAAKANPAAHAIQLEQCTRATIEDVTVYGSNGFSFFERNCSESRYNRCKVDRGRVLPGTAPRLRSGNADGIHSSMAKIGPLIENCEVKHTGDDCIVVCGRSFPISHVDTAAKTIYVLSREANPVFYPGDTLQHVFYVATKGSKVKMISATAYAPTSAEQIFIKEKYPNLLYKNYTRGMRIVLETVPQNLNPGDIVYNDTHTGKGFTIRHNQLGYNRSRGILIKSSNGEIYHNEINGTAMNALLVAPELTWMGGGFASHLTIRDNIISNCMFEKTNKGMPPGVVSIFCADAKLNVPPVGAFTSIKVYNNKVEKSPLPGFVFTAVDGLSQYNNKTFADQGNVREHGKNFGVISDAVTWEKNNNDIQR
ncbi:hypothetical protein DU508_13715 [Pedobacter chinensis]|uniref:Right-handed parallel beta-helix repeat-containing protein n=1 Tax=Pedobacter chinensis TaxID=2282421 RepID=A0A369PTD2_9SPHI|nr:hypothetical protein [Pedobacter chinensis]RDC55921.1 hypothetical protein DU508_13715 [Pedobacter chinensis]